MQKRYVSHLIIPWFLCSHLSITNGAEIVEPHKKEITRESKRKYDALANQISPSISYKKVRHRETEQDLVLRKASLLHICLNAIEGSLEDTSQNLFKESQLFMKKQELLAAKDKAYLFSGAQTLLASIKAVISVLRKGNTDKTSNNIQRISIAVVACGALEKQLTEFVKTLKDQGIEDLSLLDEHLAELHKITKTIGGDVNFLENDFQ